MSELDGNEEKANGVATGRVEDRVTESKDEAGITRLPEADKFGLPVRKRRRRSHEDDDEREGVFEDAVQPDLPPQVVQEVKVTEDVRESAAYAASMAEDEPEQTATAHGVCKVPTASDGEFDAEGQPQKLELDKAHVLLAGKAKAEESAPSVGRAPVGAISECSHQQLVAGESIEETKPDDGEWQEMPAVATHTIYDDWGKVLAREYAEVEDQKVAYGTLGGAGKGYTRVQVDDDAQSATSLDDNTAYLFKDGGATHTLDEDDEGRDLVSQMQTTKELLTEGQRVAYVGAVRLCIFKMVEIIELMEHTNGTIKYIDFASEAARMWGQKIMIRLYAHMEIDSAEQLMVEQLANHGVIPADLTPALMQNARVKNPKPVGDEECDDSSQRLSTSSPSPPSTSIEKRLSAVDLSAPSTPGFSETVLPPPYKETATTSDLTVKDLSQLPDTHSIDLDIRWTVLCDLFLVLIADSGYDSRSRTLLENVGRALGVDWLEMCRFEKRVTDALELQEAADKENWNETEHMESRKKSSRKKRLIAMGLCTVGGGLVIGLSAGLLAPVIGAGLAAGFTTIGVAGTSSFLAGAGGAAIIASTGVVTGGTIAVRASNRRTGSIKTFEYRPLHNNKRVNLIVTVSGWMAGIVDDVRLPFSTIDPIMGDIYSVHWEPEMLQSTGQTINILATEALTQTIQQILGSTILTALMAGLSLPIVLTKLAYLIDNPWSVSLSRADAAGLILADSLIDRNLGSRPITLVGFSLGSRLIFSCLKELAARGAMGLVQNVFLYGTPLVAKRDEYLRAKTAVSGRFVNGYATNDWILGYLFRATSGGIMRIAGLNTVEVSGVENIDVTVEVPGHMAYRAAMPILLRQAGWMVESDEFTEIEDPDPDNHEKRQRELINEIEEARRQLEGKPEKKGIKAWFSRSKKVAEKQEWETYDEKPARPNTEGKDGDGHDVMFDVDAVTAEARELAAQGIEIKEIKGTMPVMKVSMDDVQASSPTTSPKLNGVDLRSNGPYVDLKQTKSFDGSAAARAKAASSSSLTSGMNGNGRGTPNRRSLDLRGHEDRDSPIPGHQHLGIQSAAGEEEISLSFEPLVQDRHEPPGASPGLHTNHDHTSYRTSAELRHAGSPSRPPEPSIPGSTLPIPKPQDGTSERPTLPKSPTVTHVPTNVMQLEHNAWAEEDEWEKEREMQLSFE